jgi:hypothetical protein
MEVVVERSPEKSGVFWTPVHPPSPSQSTLTGPYSEGKVEQGMVPEGKSASRLPLEELLEDEEE